MQLKGELISLLCITSMLQKVTPHLESCPTPSQRSLLEVYIHILSIPTCMISPGLFLTEGSYIVKPGDGIMLGQKPWSKGCIRNIQGPA